MHRCTIVSSFPNSSVNDWGFTTMSSFFLFFFEFVFSFFNFCFFFSILSVFSKTILILKNMFVVVVLYCVQLLSEETRF